MSRRGRSFTRNNYNKSSAYPYRNNDNKHSQHDDRFRGNNSSPRRDNESGEHYNRQYNDGNYKRGGGRGVYRGYMGRRPRGRNSNRRGRWRGGGRYQGGDRRNQGSPSYVDDDGDIDMDGETRVRARPTPYDRPNRKPNMSYHEKKEQSRGPSWSFVTVIQGASLDHDWLMDAIQREAMVQFTPVQYHIDGDNASFCIENPNVAFAIRECNKKISSPDGNKLTILKASCSPPIMDNQLMVLKKVLSDRYNTETLHLNASALFRDPDLRKEDIVIRVNQSRDMNVLLNIISEHIAGLTSLDLSDNKLYTLQQLKPLVQRTPHLKCLKLANNVLKHVRELDFVKDWNLTEMKLDGNPLCAHFKEQADYISAARDRFSDLIVLDDQKLPPPVKFDVEKATKLVPPVANHIPDSVTHIIKEFVKQYFSIYDSNREDLVAAYHHDCMFSLCIPPTPRGPPLSVYFQHSRNLQRMKSMSNKLSFLKKSQIAVCALLKELPKTEHDMAGFSVDVPLATPTMIKFTIRGLFREHNEGKKTLLRAFTRAFLCLTDGSRLSIINEELYIRNVTRSEMKSAFVKPPVTPSPSPVPEVTAPTPVSTNKLEVIAAFSKESGMNASFSEQCLNEHGWDYSKAGQAFLVLKEQGKIPPEAFAQ